MEYEIRTDVGIQKGGISYYNTKKGQMMSDGINLIIINKDGTEVLNVPIEKIRKISFQLGAVYIYHGLRLTTVNLANAQNKDMLLNVISPYAGLANDLSKKSDAETTINLWRKYFTDKGIKVKSLRHSKGVWFLGFLVVIYIILETRSRF